MAPAEGEHDLSYEITLGREDGAKLGIDVDTVDHDTRLLVTLVREGLVSRWNDDNPGLMVEPGHLIVEVNGVRDSASGMKAECKAAHTLSMVLRRPPKPVRLAPLPDAVWMRVVWHLHAHELLGRFAVLGVDRAAMLGDERCWRTLAMPSGPKRLAHFLRLVTEQEQELWAWPLVHVRVLDLDLHGCAWSAVECLQKLLLQGVDLSETLCSVRLRRVPAIPPAGEGAQRLSPKDQELVRLVNPIVPNFPAAEQTCFCLLPGELAQLRLRLAGFGHFRMTPSRDELGLPMPAVDITADRGPLACDAGEADAAAMQVLEQELGELRRLPAAAKVWARQDFAGWSRRVLPSYRKLLRDHAA